MSDDKPKGRADQPLGHSAASSIRPDHPERIYAFADALEAERERETDTDTGPAPRPETWVSFEIDREIYALPVEPVKEVLRVTEITRVPHAPKPVRGVTQLRGRVIPVVDLALRLGLPGREQDQATRILVVGSKGRLIGLLVDRVHQVMQLDRNRAQAPPEDVMTSRSDFVTAVYHLAERLILMLDVDRVLLIQEAQDAA
jgi:purine-binding chemotaxis protein CheW